MNALDKLNVLGLVVSAVLLAMACVKADRVRSWRSNINPSAPELPDAAFVAARVLFVTLAAIGIYTAIQGFGVSDDTSWDDSELTSAVQQAVDDLDGYTFTADDSGTPLSFDDYTSLLKDKVVQYGGGDAPQTGVTVTPADTDTYDDAHLTVTAAGTDAAFCTRIERTRSKKDDYTPPGITGGEGSLTYRGYRLSATTQKGEC
ncbi:hypothetical protein AB0C13_22965 [Streptomyces sp. NPDC049099]|uniref:hypothetical protein n=1 Tax=Streptomyces sp. NPDC049099 TaxID=3155768 RepID=UPI00341F5426